MSELATCELSCEEADVVDLVRTGVDRKVKPVVQELEHANTYPEQLIEQMKEMGIYGLAIPEPWGSAAVSTPSTRPSPPELARGWMSLAGAMGGSHGGRRAAAQLRHPRAAGPLPTKDGRRGDPGHHGSDRAGWRLRPAGDANNSPHRRRRIRYQRLKT